MSLRADRVYWENQEKLNVFTRNTFFIEPEDIAPTKHLIYERKLRGVTIDISVLLDWPGHYEDIYCRQEDEDLLTDWTRDGLINFESWCETKQINQYTVVEIEEVEDKGQVFKTDSGYHKFPSVYDGIFPITVQGDYCKGWSCEKTRPPIHFTRWGDGEDKKKPIKVRKCRGCEAGIKDLIEARVDEARARCSYIWHKARLLHVAHRNGLILNILDKWAEFKYPPFIRILFSDKTVYDRNGQIINEAEHKGFLNRIKEEGRKFRSHPHLDNHPVLHNWGDNLDEDEEEEEEGDGVIEVENIEG